MLPDGDPHTHAPRQEDAQGMPPRQEDAQGMPPRQEDAQGTPWLLIHTKALGTRQFKSFATTTTQQRKIASETTSKNDKC